jgi:prophage regulatory protein
MGMPKPREKADAKVVWRSEDVQAQLGVSRRCLVQWESRGQFPRRRRLGGRTVGWLRDDIIAWLKHRPFAPMHEGKDAPPMP